MDAKRSQRYSILGLEGSEWDFYFMDSSDIPCENIEFRKFCPEKAVEYLAWHFWTNQTNYQRVNIKRMWM